MEKKRSKGITIFSWLIILGSVLAILNFKQNQELNPAISNYLYFIICPLSIFAAIDLLKLKNWARVAIIAISIIVAIETLATVSNAINMYTKNAIKEAEVGFYKGHERGAKYSEPQARELSKEELGKDKELTLKIIKTMATIMAVMMLLVSLGFNGGVIYYFTRPKVKEQFKEE